MQSLAQSFRLVLGTVALSIVLLLALVSPSLTDSQAQPPPPPTKTPIPPVTSTPTLTPSLTPTGTATSTPTATPTGTASATPTQSPTPTKSPTPSPSPTASASPSPTQTGSPTSAPTATGGPPPSCGSIVGGYVLNVAGQRVANATVRITGSGHNNQTLTDNNGHYSFGGLCAGTYTLQASLPNGRQTAPATAGVDGQNSVTVDLRVSLAETAQPGSTSEPEMPTTGSSGWLLIGGAFLGALLLLSAGARRFFGSRQV